MRLAYVQITCACGRKIGANVIRQHRRRCEVQLEAWRREGASVDELDEREHSRRGQVPIDFSCTCRVKQSMTGESSQTASMLHEKRPRVKEMTP